MDSRVQKVVIFMEANPCRTLSLSEMASTVNLSVARLRLLFKAATGMSPTQYFKLLRMQDAKSILEATFLPIKQIAARVGCNDVSLWYGSSPSKSALIRDVGEVER
jgi:transcriptional regulator GlxA family with amidase domain